MKIEKEKTFGHPSIKFTDSMGDTCYIWIMDNLGELRFDLDTDFAQFTQEDIKALLPYLQAYAETGQLEPTPTLQGENETFVETTARQDREIKMLEIEKAYYMRQVDQQVDHIANLEELVEEWREFATSDGMPIEKLAELQEKTSQLLGE